MEHDQKLMKTHLNEIKKCNYWEWKNWVKIWKDVLNWYMNNELAVWTINSSENVYHSFYSIVQRIVWMYSVHVLRLCTGALYFVEPKAWCMIDRSSSLVFRCYSTKADRRKTSLHKKLLIAMQLEDGMKRLVSFSIWNDLC